METIKVAKDISPSLAFDKLKKGALFVDVRNLDEIEQVSFNIPEIIFIPINEFKNRWLEIPKNREIILVCQVGARSLRATYYLMSQGYEQVFNMEYGIEKWVKEGFPINGELEEKTSNAVCCSLSSGNGGCC